MLSEMVAPLEAFVFRPECFPSLVEIALMDGIPRFHEESWHFTQSPQPPWSVNRFGECRFSGIFPIVRFSPGHNQLLLYPKRVEFSYVLITWGDIPYTSVNITKFGVPWKTAETFAENTVMLLTEPSLYFSPGV